jgi:hypothetical protein
MYEATNSERAFANRPLATVIQFEGFKDDIELYKFQLDAITWMKSIEDRVGQDLTYRTIKRWKGSQLYFDLEKCLLIPPQEVPNYTFQEEIKGGVLADKYWSITWKERALEILGLILAAPSSPNPEPHFALIESRATLIVCPFYEVKLHESWKSLIANSTNLKTCIIGDYDDMKKISYAQIRSEFDIIVFASHIFETLQYFWLPKRKKRSYYNDKERDELVISARKKLKSSGELDATCPIIEHFYFHRIVIDGSHGIDVTQFGYPMINRLWGRSKWYVKDANAFKKEQFILQFLGFKKDSSHLKHQMSVLLKDYCWRNAKESKDISIPIVAKSVELDPSEANVSHSEPNSSKDPQD